MTPARPWSSTGGAALRCGRRWRASEFSWREAPPQCLSYSRGRFAVLLNGGTEPVPLPAGEVVLASGPLVDGQLPPDTAVWVRTTPGTSRTGSTDDR